VGCDKEKIFCFFPYHCSISKIFAHFIFLLPNEFDQQIRLHLVNDISLTNIESTKNIYPVLTRLNLFNEIDRAWRLRWQDIVAQNASLSGTTTSSLHGVMKFDAHIPTSEGKINVNF